MADVLKVKFTKVKHFIEDHEPAVFMLYFHPGNEIVERTTGIIDVYLKILGKEDHTLQDRVRNVLQALKFTYSSSIEEKTAKMHWKNQIIF